VHHPSHQECQNDTSVLTTTTHGHPLLPLLVVEEDGRGISTIKEVVVEEVVLMGKETVG